jgi:hypothetical protein
MQKLWSKANEEPPPLAADGSPDPFDPVIARAVARDPERRFRSAGDLARAASMAAGADAEAPTERSVATGVAATGMLEVDPPAERVPRVRHPSLREQPTNQLPRPPAPATGRKRGAEGSGRTVALLVGSLALAIGLVVAAVVVAGDKDGANRTVITRAAETTASEEAPSTSSEGEGASARAETAPAPVEFNGSYFSTTLPVGWRQVENESWASDGSYVENTWISPDGGEEIKIDMSVGEPADPAVSLATIGGAVEESGQTVYATTNGVEHGGIVGSELDFSADSGIPERADFFFNFDGNGFAVMGSSYDLETSQALIGPVVAALSTSH